MAVQRITADHLKRLMDSGEQLTVLDTRSADSWKSSNVQIPGSKRVSPDDVQEHLSEIPRDRLVVAYCT